jgi:hypothetical protein
MATWIESGVDIRVFISAAGPFDQPFSFTGFDITSYIDGNGIHISRGRSDEFTSFQAGECRFKLRNNLREFDPANASSPFLEILRPMRRVQVVVIYNSTLLYSLFVGYVDGWPRAWTKTTGSVEVVCHDSLAAMARAKISPSHGVLTLDDMHHGRLDFGRLAGDLPEQTTSERVLALLQLAGFTSGTDAEVDNGVTNVVAASPEGNILSLIQDAEAAESGFFFVDSEGVIRFFNRHARFLKDRSANVQMTLDDEQYTGLEVQRNLNQVWNDVAFTRPGGEGPMMAGDQESLHDFGILSYDRELPVVSDGELQGRADFFISRYSQPLDRPTPIEVRPRKDMATLFPFVNGVELLDRIEIERTPLGVGATTTFTGLVEQITHDITNDDWVTTLATSPVDVDDDDDFLTLDDLVDGQLDIGAVAY